MSKYQSKIDSSSNEETYRKTWASFVDKILTERHLEGGARDVGSRVDLRDLMDLEGFLSTIALQREKHDAGRGLVENIFRTSSISRQAHNAPRVQHEAASIDDEVAIHLSPRQRKESTNVGHAVTAISEQPRELARTFVPLEPQDEGQEDDSNEVGVILPTQTEGVGRFPDDMSKPIESVASADSQALLYFNSRELREDVDGDVSLAASGVWSSSAAVIESQTICSTKQLERLAVRRGQTRNDDLEQCVSYESNRSSDPGISTNEAESSIGGSTACATPLAADRTVIEPVQSQQNKLILDSPIPGTNKQGQAEEFDADDLFDKESLCSPRGMTDDGDKSVDMLDAGELSGILLPSEQGVGVLETTVLDASVETRAKSSSECTPCSHDKAQGASDTRDISHTCDGATRGPWADSAVLSVGKKVRDEPSVNVIPQNFASLRDCASGGSDSEKLRVRRPLCKLDANTNALQERKSAPAIREARIAAEQFSREYEGLGGKENATAVKEAEDAEITRQASGDDARSEPIHSSLEKSLSHYERQCSAAFETDIGLNAEKVMPDFAAHDTLDSTLSPAIADFGWDAEDEPSPLPRVEPWDDDCSLGRGGAGDPISPAASTCSNDTLDGAEDIVTSNVLSPPREGERALQKEGRPLLLESSSSTQSAEHVDADVSQSTISSRSLEQKINMPHGCQRQRSRGVHPERGGTSSAEPLRLSPPYGSDHASLAVPPSSDRTLRSQPGQGALDASLGERRYSQSYHEACAENVSIHSFSSSGTSRSGSEADAISRRDRSDNLSDSSLVEGTPRRPSTRRVVYLSGTYPVLPVKNIGAAFRDAELSSVQRGTCEWMVWRERSEAMRTTPLSNTSRLGEKIRGGILGHLAAADASACIVALIQRKSEILGGGDHVAVRAAYLDNATGLPQGQTLLVAATRDAAEEWADRLSASAGLSLLRYVMPLKERRRLSLGKIASFDVVITTYDILKAKEVPRVTSGPVSSGAWHSRNSPDRRRKRNCSKAGHTASQLHAIWWKRVVADSAHILVNTKSARAVALAQLVGRSRWCVVGRESMHGVEGSSDRLRSLADFVRVPGDMSLVEASPYLFYGSRPSSVAQIGLRGSELDDDLDRQDGPCWPRNRRRPSSQRDTIHGARPCVAHVDISASDQAGEQKLREKLGDEGCAPSAPAATRPKGHDSREQPDSVARGEVAYTPRALQFTTRPRPRRATVTAGKRG